MEFRILGPLEVRDGDAALALGGGKQRALLARLLLAAGRTIAVERLVDDLWGESAPGSAVKMVQIYVSQLRRLLPEGMLVTRRPGYVLEVEPERIDVVRFARLREEGRAALASGDAAGAAATLRAGLALWRGTALGEFSEPFAAVERAHLEELHLACLEDRIDADLAVGRHDDLAGELERLVGGHPLRERLRGQLMLALYRAGRHAEALDAYRRFRAALDAELGIAPSPALRDLERRILQHDAGLELRSRSHPAAGAAPARGGVAPGHSGTRFAQNGDVSIAYQVVGDGPLDLVLVHGWVCSFDPGWERDQIARFYRRLASFGRLILFDKRGTGLSDRVAGVAPLEDRMDDVRAVMDAVGSERAALLGISEGGPMVALFAATYPERTAALVAMGTFARRTPAPDYPFEIPALSPSAEEWGLPIARAFVEQRTPSLAGDEEAVRWYASYFLRGASPGAAIALRAMNDEIDVRHVLPTIGVPTLVLYRSQEYLREATRYMGDHIPGARVVELPGADHLPWEGDQDDVLGEIERFLATVGADRGPERILATILTTRLGGGEVGDSEPALRLQALVRNQLPRFRGEALGTSSSATTARFDGPARAIRCACAVVDLAAARGLDVRAGLHTGECAVLDGGATSAAAAISARIAALAQPGEVLVSSTVRDLVAGSAIEFEERPSGTPAQPALADLRLFAIGSAPVAA
jgi:DNA-binding SARP family transcriptional activator/pimeloyl-ACP methyl ester carboxylesterase